MKIKNGNAVYFYIHPQKILHSSWYIALNSKNIFDRVKNTQYSRILWCVCNTFCHHKQGNLSSLAFRNIKVRNLLLLGTACFACDDCVILKFYLSYIYVLYIYIYIYIKRIKPYLLWYDIWNEFNIYK